jgi:hypothetical protein
VFVVYFFFNYVSGENKSLIASSLNLRRWELLHYVLLGHGRTSVDEIML